MPNFPYSVFEVLSFLLLLLFHTVLLLPLQPLSWMGEEEKKVLRKKPLVPKLALAARVVATTASRGKIGGNISLVFPSLSRIEPPTLPDQYAEPKGMCIAGPEEPRQGPGRN